LLPKWEYFFIPWFAKNDANVHDFAHEGVFFLYYDLSDVAKKRVHRTFMPKNF